jgi:hypothetical protein
MQNPYIEAVPSGATDAKSLCSNIPTAKLSEIDAQVKKSDFPLTAILSDH